MKLLTNEEVISILEKDKNQNKYLKANKKVELFSDDIYKIVEKEEILTSPYSMTEGNNNLHFENSYFDGLDKTRSTENLTAESTLSLEPSPKKVPKKSMTGIKKMYQTEPRPTINIFDKEFQLEKSNYLIQLKSIVAKAEDHYTKDINTQTEQFNLLRKQKIIRQGEKTPKSKPYIKRNQSILNACNSHKSEDTLNILNNIMELSEKKILCIQKQMQVEIESFINSNLEEMYKNLEELKITYEKEIKLMEESGYPHVCKSLQEDMKNEMEVLKEQYEEQRRNGIEKIKLKYNKSLK